MLETLREYGLDQLAASGEEATVRGAHAAWCLDLAERSVPAWFSPAQKRWGERIEAEHASVRAALTWLAETGDTAAALRLIASLWPFWFLRSHFTEGRDWLERALGWSAGTRTAERVRVLNGAASIAVWQGDWPHVEVWCEESLAIAREIGDAFGTGNAMLVLGHAALAVGDHDQAIRMHEAALAVMRALGDTVANAPTTASALLGNLADVALSQGDHARATRLAEEALAVQRERGFAWGAAHSLFTLAAAARVRGDVTWATALYRECLADAWAEQDLRILVRPLDSLAILAAEGGQAERAAHLFGAAARLHELLGTRLDPTDQPHQGRAVAGARARLGDPAFETAWASGRAMPLAQVVAEASRIEGAPSPGRTSDPAARSGLTRREREILPLLAAGHTDREIAAALFVSHRTVNAHVASILAKLGVATRRDAAAWARANVGRPPHT
jgi:non-specific serine/threonine protein kinase